MTTEITLTFVTGQYQGTPWNRAVNEGIAEWPPGAWRLLRALISTWHTRCADVPAESMDSLLSQLVSERPSYLVPDSRMSHTRHYMPGLAHKPGEKVSTSLHFAPRVNLDPDNPVLVQWPGVDLSESQRALLDRLLGELPYVGRAESSVLAALVRQGEEATVDGRWHRPDADGPARILVPAMDVTRSDLEITPDAVRKAKLRTPIGAEWASYTSPAPDVMPLPVPAITRPTTVRWLLSSSAPVREQAGVLATHGLRGAVLGTKAHHEVLRAIDGSWLLAGPHDQTASNHRHAHWLWLPGESGEIRELALWVPAGIPEEFISRIAGARQLPRYQYAPKGYRGGAALHLRAMGNAPSVLPELVSASSTRWRSTTPFLTDRHPKKHRDRLEFSKREVERELRSRWGDQPPEIVDFTLLADWESPDTVSYRRYRWTETMAKRRRGMLMEFTLSEPLPPTAYGEQGPVSLGALSHFGFGLFVPIA